MEILLLLIGMAIGALVVYVVLSTRISRIAKQQFDKWRAEREEDIKRNLDSAIRIEYESKLRQWMSENEERIRQDAAQRSTYVLTGRVGEHLAPFSTKYHFNPRDTRFLGSPVDLICFEGLTSEDAELAIHFVEVKTGKSGLTKPERRVREAVEGKRVFWHVLTLEE
jgi:predicted Holliday junction resolvase-like endonuclease